MHELSIALNIIDIATEEAQKAGKGNILSLELEVGILSGVLIEALSFALEVAVKGTVLENCRIELAPVEALARCSQCGHIFGVEDLYTACPRCDSFDTRLVKGGELKFRSLTLEEH